MPATEAVFRDDAYRRKITAKVIGLTDTGGIVLDRTIFYATSGGQPGDTGRLIRPDGPAVAIAATVTGETKDDIIFVRNPKLGMDYEVSLSRDRYYAEDDE